MNKYHDFRSFFVWKHIRVKRGIVDIPLGNINNYELNYWIVAYVKNASRSYPSGQGWIFVAICILHLSRRHVHSMTPWCGFRCFWAFRWGRVEKMKKMTFSRGRCRKSEKSRSHAAWQSKKKTSPMQHGNVKNDFCDTSRARMLVCQSCIFLLLWFFVNLRGGKSVSNGDAVEIFIFLKKIRFNKKTQKWKCC